MLGLIDPLQKLGVFVFRLLKHLEVKRVVTLADDIEPLLGRVLGSIIDHHFVIEHLSVHEQEITPEFLVCLVADLTRVTQVEHPKGNKVFLLNSAVINLIVINEVVAEGYRSLLRGFLNNREHALTNEAGAEEAKHLPVACAIHLFF